MEKIGKVVHLAKSGRLIVKIEENIDHNVIGQTLIDDKGARVGKIIELIGSVKSPYASVIPSQDSKYFIGGTVYKTRIQNQRVNSSKKDNKFKRRKR